MSRGGSKWLGELHSEDSFLVFGYWVFKRFCETSCHDNTYQSNYGRNSKSSKPPNFLELDFKYHKAAKRSTSCLVAHPGIFRLLMKGKFEVYFLWPFGEKLMFEIVAQSTIRNSMVLFLKVFITRSNGPLIYLPSMTQWKYLMKIMICIT